MLKFRRFWGDERGAVVHIFAITFMLLLTIIGFGIDISSAISQRERLQNAADQASVTTTRALLAGEIDVKDAEAYAKAAFQQIAAGYGAGGSSPFGEITFDSKTSVKKITKDGATTYKVVVEGGAEVPASPMSFFLRDGGSGKNKMSVGFKSETTGNTEQVGGAYSMALVLDKSGSMGWNYPTRMSVLKQAVGSLVSTLKESDKENKYARLGAYAYTWGYYGKFGLNWDKDAVQRWVNGLQAGGGTAAYSTIATARNDLLSAAESSAHMTKNGQKPEYFILYMTDGIDGRPTQARQECQRAKDAGITIYTVAFQAPASGKQLLRDCATSNKHYYDANNANQLNAIFKKIAKEAVSTVPFISG